MCIERTSPGKSAPRQYLKHACFPIFLYTLDFIIKSNSDFFLCFGTLLFIKQHLNFCNFGICASPYPVGTFIHPTNRVESSCGMVC